MNPLKKGPEIKLSDLKIPGFVSEIYYGLDERHLLPLVVVLLAAIVAVPLALSESPESNPVADATPYSAASSSTTQVVVAKSAPGLRDYRKRLAGLRAKDPFKQQFSDAEEAGTTAPAEEATGSGEETGEETGTTEGGGTSGSTATVTHHIAYYSWTIDVRIVPVSSNGKPSTAKPTVRRDQPELTMLPGRQTPATIFMGPSSDGKKALMLVSSNVTAVFGEATCVLGGETCEMVALEPGVPETFVYGGNQRIFRIELQKIRLSETEKLNRAPLGEPKSGNRPQGQRQTAVAQAVLQPR
jgi:hypothetical protein